MGQIFFTKAEVKGLTTKQKQMLRAKAIEGIAEASQEIIKGVMADTTGAKTKALIRRKLEPMRSRLKSSKRA